MEPFRFKKFICKHDQSSMKIGVDAVLLGAWADVNDCRTILDTGTGCGVIALMCAQRNESAQIIGIDIDQDSIIEATENFNNSAWNNNLSALYADFNELYVSDVDLIISNPPYFDSGISTPDSRRLKARHQDGLNPYTLISTGKNYLSESGRIALIIPYEQTDRLTEYAEIHDMYPCRITYVKGHPNAPMKRTLIEFCRVKDTVSRKVSNLVLEFTRGTPTEEYKSLCKEFYLKF